MNATLKKQHGIHYTPPELARFLARQAADCFLTANNGSLVSTQDRISVLDPACGDGELLASLIQTLRRSKSIASSGLPIDVIGFETDSAAAASTRARLARFEQVSVEISDQDFLVKKLGGRRFDCVIANPPYVRTQVLGGATAKRLAQKFDLTGRVDLYQAFMVAIIELLRPGGALGLLTSNRFLTVRSGQAVRRLLRTHFDLQHIFDLGDTRLFDAAVLPVVLSAVKREPNQVAKPVTPTYTRIYRAAAEDGNTKSNPKLTLLEAVEDPALTGAVETCEGSFLIERGQLVAENEDSVWSLGNSTTRRWLQQVRSQQTHRFGDLAEIKVGIKTTADAVFIREDWGACIPAPESELILPLITHHDAQRWTINTPQKRVLYPYDFGESKRMPVNLSDFPAARDYLELHRQRLEGRRYVVDSRRKWYEIWVPHQPAQWANPKLVWPDISEEPRFFLDRSGAIVNGDCYWIKLREGVDSDWLYLMLAVANSSLATRFYDTVFHNKLYAGRRRYMTQYVNEFPLPDLESEIGTEIVGQVKQLVRKPSRKIESQVENLVSKAFGFAD